ncbi:MAG: sugar ABC transporter substrate-binding protein [Quadrisphaera sp.]
MSTSAPSHRCPSRVRRGLAAATAALALTVTGCASYGVDQGGDGESGTITYWMWDSAQLPAYQQCATDFHATNPDVDVQIEQFGWDDYWNKLFTGFVAGSAPDVFVDHTSRFGEFAARGLIEPLDDRVAASGLDLGQYVPGSAELWVGPDGKRYGLPKDFDTVGMFYNAEMATEAGLTPEQMNALTWNPTDGGTFEKAIAHLTVDTNGVRGDEPGFDKSSIATYGLGLENSGEAFGQTQWSWFTQTTGWSPVDEAWGTTFHYDDPRFQQSISWWTGLVDKGYMPPLSLTQGGSLDQQLQAGKYALITNGSWNIANYSKLKGLQLAVAKTPVGPEGRRTMTNSLGDSISTTSQNKGAAWKWVRYLASPACQDVVARGGIVFPAIASTTPAAVETLSKTGLDVTAFTDPIADGETFPYPEILQASEVQSIMGTAMDQVVGGQAPASSLTAVNGRVEAVFQ